MNRASRYSGFLCVKRGATIALLVAIGACGSDSTSPNGVSGRWSYSATAGSCSISGATMSLTQSGTAVTGSVSGGFLSCVVNMTIDSVLTGPFPIANGTISGSGVLFDFSPPGIFAGIGRIGVHNVGTVSGNSMSGTVTLANVLGNSVLFTGNFSAVRQ